MAERPHTKNLLMFENDFNLRGLGANNYNLRATFKEAPIKTFLCRADPYLVIYMYINILMEKNC